MYFKTLALASLAVAATAIDPDLMECGADEPMPKHIASMKEASIVEARSSPLNARASVTVPVYVHVVAKSKSAEDGYISSDAVDNHISDLNNAYSNTDYQFELQDTDWTINKNWSSWGDEYGMKKELRKGDYGTLNLYYTTFVKSENVAGTCHFPTDAETDSEDFYLDGCAIRYDSRDSTTPHEVGHWFGLFHTFQGGCGDDGDYVDDTPACEKTFKCPEDSDTCTDDDALDPIDNFMGYNSCRDRFTKGQAARIRTQFNKYRAN